MQHSLKISVSKQPQVGGIVACKCVSIRERFLRFLFGSKHQLMIIAPGDSVQELAIHEISDGGTNDEVV